VVRYDHRGYGRSSPPDSTYSPVDDLVRLLDTRGIEPATLVGSAFGGRLALDAALLHPERVVAVALVGSSAGGFPIEAGETAEIGRVFRTAESAGVARAAELLVRHSMVAVTSRDRATRARLRALVDDNRAALAMRHWPNERLSPPAAERLATLHVPVLVVMGEFDAPVVWRHAELTARGIPGAQRAVVRGADHLPQMTHPEELNRLLRRFLRQVERGGAAPAAAGAAGGDTLRPLSARERATVLAALDSLWVAFDPGSAGLSAVDSVALDDLAATLRANPGVRLRTWASAPDALGAPSPPPEPAPAPPAAPTRPTAPTRPGAGLTGSGTRLAADRREAVRGYLLARGARPAQVAVQAEDPERFPAEVQWRSVGGAFLFVAEAPATLLLPAEQARVRVRAVPGSEVFLLPRAVADRDSALVCAPPLVTRFEVVGADSVVERPYPPRPVLTVARDPAGVVVTRHHAVDARRDPDLIDLLTALPDPRCRP
jgi:pimeloyl-ACP methyl ester carboxylesterase